MPRRRFEPSWILWIALFSGGCGGDRAGATGPTPVVPITAATAAPVAASTLTAKVSGVAVGRFHACAIDGARRVRCWGSNERGQLGDGTRRASATPVTVPGLESVVEVGAGWNRTCALTAGGEVFCWGDDEVRVVLRPEKIEGMAGAKAISVESARLCAVMRSGEVLCRGTEWLGDGFDKHGGSPIVAEVLGVRDAVAVRDGCVLLGDGSVRCWGPNRDGQAGDGTRAERLAPVRVRGIGNATAIAVGDRHACALLENGEIACWGWAAIGDGERAQMRLAPARVPGIAGARAIDARDEITCAALEDGQVACWGGAQLGTLAAGEEGDLTADPPQDPRVEARVAAKVPGALDVAAIAVDADHACARTTAGGVVCWGTNLDGELGTGVAGSTEEIVDVEGIPDATRVTTGENHACALRAGGSVWCWGDGRRGQLGDGTLQSRGVPAKVPGIEDAIDVSAELFHTCAALRDGTVMCWGTTVPERDGVDRDRIWRAPKAIAGVTGAKRIAVARERACARLGSGRVVCWGEDSFGALGVTGGAKPGKLTPVTGLTKADAVVMGLWGACATTTSRAVWCWGAGAITAWAPGRPDDPPANEGDVVKPKLVRSLRDVTGIGLYGLLSCVIRGKGQVACWDSETRAIAPDAALTPDDDVDGLDDAVALSWNVAVRRSGEVVRIDTDMTGARKWRMAPFAPAMRDAVSVAQGGRHTCAVRRSGAVACWGDDSAGQLGAGTRGRSARAVPVIGIP